MLPVEPPFKLFTGRDGKPLDRGFVYFGLPNQNPITAPVTVYWDAAGTQPAFQPLRTENGYIVRKGTPANVFFDGSYSVLVQDAKRRQVFIARNSDDFSIATVVQNFLATIASSAGSSLIGFTRNAVGSVATTVGRWMGWQPPSVLDFMTEAQRTDVLAGTCLIDVSAAVQAAVDYCLGNNKDLTVEGLCRIDTPVNINRPVNGSTDEFHILARNSKAGFWTSNPISMFSASIPGFTPGGAASEFVVFDKVRFEASVNTLNAFAVDGDAFLRIKFNHCYWRKIRNAYTSNFFQSWHFISPNVRHLHGIFMEAGIGGESYVGLDGFSFDIHVTDPIFEEGDMVGQSAGFKFAGQWNGGSIKGGLYQGQTGPFVEVVGGGTVLFAGTYFEAVTQSCFKLGSMYNAVFDAVRFGTGTDPNYFPIDCQTAYTVIGTGNFSEGNIYKSSNMRSTRTLNDAGFYKSSAKGLVTLGDVAYNGNVTDDPNHANNIKRIQTETMFMGLNDFSFGAAAQRVAVLRADGVSGVTPTAAFTYKTTSGFRDTCKLEMFISDAPNGEYAAPAYTVSNGMFMSQEYLGAGVALKLTPRPTGSVVYEPGVLYYDSTLDKLRIGGATGFETITSV